MEKYRDKISPSRIIGFSSWLIILKKILGDYPTPDGTGVRDYIHVMDLADGHVAALKKMFSADFCGVRIYNLGESIAI